MKCPKCGKPIKENTDGNEKYCQGHSTFDFDKPKEDKIVKKSISNIECDFGL